MGTKTAGTRLQPKINPRLRPFHEFIEELSRKLVTDHGRPTLGTVKFTFNEVKMSKVELNKLLLEIKQRQLVIEPYCYMGFDPAYYIYEIDGNPMMGYQEKEVLNFHSDQLPNNFTHDDMEKIFLSEENIRWAKLIDINIDPKRDYYY